MLEHRRNKKFYYAATDRGNAKEKSFCFLDNFESTKLQIVDASHDLPTDLLCVPCAPCISGYMSTRHVPFVVSCRHFLRTCVPSYPPMLYASMPIHVMTVCTTQKAKFSIKNFSSKCGQIHSFLRIWSHLLKKSLMEKKSLMQCLDIISLLMFLK